MSSPAFLIDASIYIFQAYFSPYNEVRDAEGEDMSAFVGFLQFLLTLQRRERPSRGAIAMDNALFSGFRHALCPDYKSNRELPDENLARQLGLCAAAASALGWPVFASERFEADDIIGTLAQRTRSLGIEAVCIVSRDKDLAQLVESDGDFMWDFTANRRRDRVALERELGISTTLIPDYLGLVGDAVDCIAGVPGIGPVKARALLQHFGTIEAMYENLDQVSLLPLRGAKSLVAKLSAHEAQARLSKRLATIVKEPVDCVEPFALVDEDGVSLSSPQLSALELVCTDAQLPSALTGRLLSSCAGLMGVGDEVVQ